MSSVRVVQKLQLRHGAGVLGHFDTPFPLASALENEVRPDGEFARTLIGARGETRAQDIQIIGVHGQHRIRAQARRDDAGIGDGDVVPLGQQTEVLLDSFFNRLIDGYAIVQGLGGH
jgi:hypothetical protein